MSAYLVTGGAGFIGSHLVGALLAGGHHVTVIDSLVNGKKANLQDLPGDVELVEADVRDVTALTRAMSGVEYVLHLAALPSVAQSIAEPRETSDVNLMGTLAVLDVARRVGVRRVVYASTCAVYGDNPQMPVDEASRTNPLSAYAVAKRAGEDYCRIYSELYGLETVALRYFNVFGPRQDLASGYAAVIPRFITALLRGEPLAMDGDGLQTRDFVFVGDVVQANLLACLAPDAVGRVFNIGCGRRTSLVDLVRMLEACTGSTPTIEQRPPRPGDVRHSQADISAARTTLKYEPSPDLTLGIRRTIEWYANHSC